MAAGDNQRLTGTVSFDTLVVQDNAYLPSSCITTANLASNLAVPSANQVHRFQDSRASQAGTVADARTCAFIARAAGTLQSLEVCVDVTAAVGDSTVTVDLYKNGSTILTGTVLINSSDAVRAINAATFSSSTIAADDVFDIVVDATAGTGTLPVGLGIDLRWDESA